MHPSHGYCEEPVTYRGKACCPVTDTVVLNAVAMASCESSAAFPCGESAMDHIHLSEDSVLQRQLVESLVEMPF